MPDVAEWSRQVDGVGIDMDNAYGKQCWDLVAHWLVTCGVPLAATYTASDGPDAGLVGSLVSEWPARPGIERHADLLPPSAPIRAGDVLVWGRTPTFPDTHTAVALGPAAAGMVPVATQNDGSAAAPTGATRRGWLPVAGLAGIIRPRALTPTPYRKDTRMHAIKCEGLPDSGVILGGGQPPRARPASVFAAECSGLGITPVTMERWKYDTIVREAWADTAALAKAIKAAK